MLTVTVIASKGLIIRYRELNNIHGNITRTQAIIGRAGTEQISYTFPFINAVAFCLYIIHTLPCSDWGDCGI